ncbi:hypothetical protein [Acinetobacter sp. ANC 5600]|uniref:hypothetical protein n=1 Tax=Acinetobacter sp. ANC 5600 TaxID=1960940 RepID=UPI000993605F|nr:hypothetical protein [Acinetobacter sp. ANC 5600]OOV83838.1 hypothetical protein B1201_00900 [Acinetobacter sp. ANC 5600]
MQKVVCFSTKLDDFGDYIFDEEFFPSNQLPAEYVESNKGRMMKLFSQIEGDITYAIYGLDNLTQSQIERVKQDWLSYLT